MIPYVVNMIFIIVVYFLINILRIKKENKNKIFINICFLELLFFLGFRKSTVGPDMTTYLEYFQQISNMKFVEIFNIVWEPLFLIINKLISFISTNRASVYFYYIIFSINRSICFYKKIFKRLLN